MLSQIKPHLEKSNKLLTILDKLQPAQPNLVSLFNPYIRGNKRRVLPLAISLCQQGYLEGERQISGGENISFVASWSISNRFLPSEVLRCIVQFDGNPELSYSLLISNFELVDYLIEVIINYQRLSKIDLPKSFYKKLLQMQ